MSSKRITQLSVNNYIYCGDYYLFLKRAETKKIDPGMMNVVGGRVEPDEDYLTACIRETEEETGLKITPKQIKFAGILHHIEGYEKDWVIAFFKTKVSTKKPKSGTKTEDGEFIWIHKDEVPKRYPEFVDDFKYIFKEIDKEKIFFMFAKMSKELKVTSYKKSLLKT